MKRTLVLFLLVVSTLLLQFTPRIAIASDDIFLNEDFSYPDGLAPAPNWIQENTECNDIIGCYIIPTVPNDDGTTALWTVLDNRYNLHVTTHNPLVFVRTIPSNWPAELTNYEVSFDINLVDSIYYDRNFVFRYIDPNHWYGIHLYSNIVYLEKAYFDNGTNKGSVLAQNSFNFEANTTYNFKISVLNNSIKIFIDSEPNPIIDHTDNNEPFLYGSSGPQAGSGSTSRGDVWFDNIIIRKIYPPAENYLLPILPLFQNDPVWGNNIYDHANSWASVNPSIARWGCALTSAVMNLRYNNHDIGVNSLNNWLNRQKDGYVRGGYLNWLAISRFSKINNAKIDSNKELPILEYKSDKDTSTNNIKLYLDNSIPPILKLPGHFVLSKGYTDSDILINDPSSINTKLSDITGTWGNPLRLDLFTPSHTDLSYFMFLLNPVNDIEVINMNTNQPLDLVVDELDQLTDPEDSNNTNSLKSTKAIYIPKPPAGLYKIVFKGNRNPINTYIYDTNGNPTISENTLKEGESLLLSSGTINYNSPNNPRGLEQDINYGIRTKLIKNKISGKLLLASAEVASRVYDRHLMVLTKSYLRILQKQINNLRAWEIDANFKIYLQTKIDLLLKTI